MSRISLQGRLWWAASGLIVIGLTVAALGINGLFRSYVEVDLAQRMQRHLPLGRLTWEINGAFREVVAELGCGYQPLSSCRRSGA